jgi:hypothetical protein
MDPGRRQGVRCRWTRKISCAIAAAILSASAQAQTWLKIGEDADWTYYVDSNFSRPEGKDVDVEMLRNLRDTAGAPVQSIKTSWSLRCADGLAGNFGMAAHAGPMGSGRVVTGEGSRSNLRMGVPSDPVDVENFRKVCQLIAGKQRVTPAPRTATASPVADDPKGVGGGASPD